MYLIKDNNILVLSAFDHERHLVSWLHIKFSDVGAGQKLCTSIVF